MNLLAESTATFDWSALLLDKGPLVAIAALVGYFVVVYGPRLFEGHIAYMKASEESITSLSSSMATLTANSTAHGKVCESTNKAVGHLAQAGKLAFTGPTAPDVHRHLDRAIDETER
jgi:hypothetical protein